MREERTTSIISTLDSAGILENYLESIHSKYSDERALSYLSVFSDNLAGELTGTNCFAPIELRESLGRLLPYSFELPKMSDLGTIILNPSSLFREILINTGLVLRSSLDSYEPNNLLIKSLLKQFKRRGIPLRKKCAKIIYFDALNLKEDWNSDYGLNYVLNENAVEGVNIFDAPELFGDERYSFSKIDRRGVPIEDKESSDKKWCILRGNGLSCFYTDCGNIYSHYERLGNNGGTVAIVRKEPA